MDFIAINGDEPRISEFFALARLANASVQSVGLTDTFYAPVRLSGAADLRFLEICCYGESLVTFEELFDQTLSYADYPNADSMKMELAHQARLLGSIR